MRHGIRRGGGARILEEPPAARCYGNFGRRRVFLTFFFSLVRVLFVCFLFPSKMKPDRGPLWRENDFVSEKAHKVTSSEAPSKRAWLFGEQTSLSGTWILPSTKAPCFHQQRP